MCDTVVWSLSFWRWGTAYCLTVLLLFFYKDRLLRISVTKCKRKQLKKKKVPKVGNALLSIFNHFMCMVTTWSSFHTCSALIPFWVNWLQTRSHSCTKEAWMFCRADLTDVSLIYCSNKFEFIQQILLLQLLYNHRTPYRWSCAPLPSAYHSQRGHHSCVPLSLTDSNFKARFW